MINPHKILRALALVSCLFSANAAFAEEPTKQAVLLATTTSTENSGLLDYLLPSFEQQGFDVQVIAVGTGKALQFGRQGDVDLLLTHAPSAEDQFVQEGYGIQALPLMHNDFVLVGPTNDPAGVAVTRDLAQALTAIATTDALFISRGDDSGTHKKERKLWNQASVQTDWEHYQEVGQGMGRTLMMADELGGYTLTDRGTWLAMNARLANLNIVFSGDPALFNPYRIVLLNPERHPHLNHSGARALAEWLTAPETLKKIGQFQVKGSALFVPIDNAQRVPLIAP